MFDRDRIIADVDLASLADELLGPRKGTGRSGTWACPSPTHAQTGRTPPLSIFRSHRGEQRWTCHGCGARGTAIDLVMVARDCDVRDALGFLADRAGVREDVRRPLPRPQKVLREQPVGDLDGLGSYVHECAARLWQPEGRAIRSWLTGERGLPEEVLRVNMIGADVGPPHQRRPRGVPRVAGAVLPVLEEDRAVFAQVRRVRPPAGQARYLNVSTSLAVNPRIASCRTPEAPRGQAVVVSEGIIDALSAAAAGYAAVAVLGAGLADEALAERLGQQHSRIVVAFDGDVAGTSGAERLCSFLAERECHTHRLHIPPAVGDLNGWMLGSQDWPSVLGQAVRSAVRTSCAQRVLERI